MKRFLLIASIVTCCFRAAYAQNVQYVTINFNPSDFNIRSNAQGQLEITPLDGDCIYLEDDTKPMLPMKKVRVCLPSGNAYNASQFSYSKFPMTSGVLAPNPMPVPASEAGLQPLPNNANPVYNGIYPSSIAEYSTTINWDGYDLAHFLVSPFEYDATDHTLYFVYQVNIAISLTNTETHSIPEQERELAQQRVRSIVVNPNEVSMLPGDPETPSVYVPIQYLIVTSQSLVSAFQPLANWKKTKGVNTEIITTEHIAQTYQGHDLQSKIKHCLYSYFGNTSNMSKYVLLGGDDSIVPVRYCYGYVDSSSGPVEAYDIPTDLFYACFEGNFEWDANNNEVYGELEDSIDINPKVIITRLPARTPQHVTDMVNKIIKYERGEKLSQTRNAILMGGCRLHCNDTVSPFHSDAYLQGELMYNLAIQPNWNGNRIRLYDTFSDLEGVGSQPFIIPNLHAELAKGYKYVDIGTHGSYDYWVMQSSGQYNSSYASTLANQGYTIITTSACHTNKFDAYENSNSAGCLSEAFLRNSNSGIIAYFGSSRYGWSYGSPKYLNLVGPSNCYSMSLYEALIDSVFPKNFGVVSSFAKIGCMGQINGYDCFRWLLFSINPIGDPEMPIFVNDPGVFSNIFLNKNNQGHISLNTYTDRVRYCLSSAEDAGGTFYRVHDFCYSYDLNSVPSNTNVCLTRDGYLPRIFNYRTHIQNETIVGNKEFIGDSIKIGADVDANSDSGDVVLLADKISITGYDIVLKNSTIVTLGTELLISNNIQ